MASSQCIMCYAENRLEIERKLAARQLTTREAGKLLGCDKSSISRHMKRHVAPTVIDAKKRERNIEVGLNVSQQLIDSHNDSRAIFDAAVADGDRRTALKALEVELRQLELNAKLSGLMPEAPTVNIATSPEFIKLKKVIIETVTDPSDRIRLSQRLDEIADSEPEPELELELRQ